MTHRVAIIGGGPAGLMVADRLSAAGLSVDLYERMPTLGRKFLMAGRGGLNITHSEPKAPFLDRYGPARAWLGPMITAFPPEDLRTFAHALGQMTFVGSSGRVFPKAMKASPWLRAWANRLAAAGVRVHLRHRFDGFDTDGGLRFETPDGSVTTRADATVLALGGASWPRLGSDGAWVAALGADGVPIAPLRPSNCGFTLAWSAPMARFAGEPVKRIALAHAGAQSVGELMVTVSGLEGGAIYALSRPLRETLDRHGHADLTIDLRPDLPMRALVQNLAEPRGKRSLSTHLAKAAGLAPVAVALLREGHGAALPTDPQALAGAIKAVRLRLTGMAGMERAISSAGGVMQDGLTPNLMLKARPGVFIAGEMLDWEAPTGGYLLQATFATAVRAASGVRIFLGAYEQGLSEPLSPADASENSAPR
jgi:hypothetical protein